MKSRCSWMCFAALLVVPSAFGHGVRGELCREAYGMQAMYDNGSPMAFSEVKVYSPVSLDKPFQEGLADSHGRFLFFPDTSGVWRVVFDDGMGHRLSEDIPVKKGLSATAGSAPGFSRPQGIITGLAVIFGVFGTLSMILSQQKTRAKRKP